jgi:hypothetical protein
VLDLRIVSQEHIPGLKRDLPVCIVAVVEYHNAYFVKIKCL